MRRAIALAPLVVGALVVALVATLGMPAPGSAAFWTSPVQGDRSSAAQATTVQRVDMPAVSVATQNDVSVDWPDATLSDGTPVAGYVVSRTNATTGASVQATGGCADVVTASACTESNVPDGRWTYSVVARFAANWVGPASAASDVAIADTVAPTNALSLDVTTGRAVLGGSTVWFRGAGNGAFRIVNALADPLSGPAQSVTGLLTGATTGWAHTPGATSAPAGGPYASNPFTWDPGTTANPTLGVSGIDVAGNTAATTLAFVDDSVAPTGGTISYATTTRRTTSTASIVVTLGAASDNAGGSGIASSGRVLERSVATLTGDACGTFGAWTAVASFASDPGSTTVAANVNTCVQHRYVVRDALGNTATTASGGIVKVKPTYQSVVAGTSNLVDYLRFESSNVLADSTGGSATTGSAQTTPTTPAGSGVVSGDTGTAAFFDGSDDYVRTPRSIAGSFSIELWFRSTQGIGTGTQWYNGAGLVDAEVSGTTNDFGISLSSDGRVMAGVGNPDRTISSQTGLNNNAWHHVVMTRSSTSGLVELWIDGQRVSTVTAGTQSLTGSANIDVGRLQTGINHFRGSIDEVAIYTRVLSQAEIQAHHANAL